MVLCIVRETWIWIRWSQSRHTGTLGKVEEQESRPSGHRQTIMLPTLSFTWFVRWRDLDVRRLYAPDLTCVLCDGAVAGELSRSSNVSDDLFGPFFWVLRKRMGIFTHNEGQSKSKLKKLLLENSCESSFTSMSVHQGQFYILSSGRMIYSQSMNTGHFDI